jgi:hypothetical protein
MRHVLFNQADLHKCDKLCQSHGCLDTPGIGPRDGASHSLRDKHVIKRSEVLIIKRSDGITPGKDEDLVYLERGHGGSRYGFVHGDGPWNVTFNDLALEVVYRQLGLCITKDQLHPLSCKRTEITRGRGRGHRRGENVQLKTTRYVLSLTDDQLMRIPEGHMRVDNMEDGRLSAIWVCQMASTYLELLSGFRSSMRSRADVFCRATSEKHEVLLI